MRKARILYKDMEAGYLTQHDDGSFTFNYHDEWLSDTSKPAISLTLPKQQAQYNSEYLFPFFQTMLPEAANKQVACRLNRIDKDDNFGLLIATSQYDSIGAIRVIQA